MDNEEMNLTHRCDSCNAHAKVRVKLKAGTLEFCGHHYNKNAKALEEQGAEVLVNNMSGDVKDKVLQEV